MNGLVDAVTHAHEREIKRIVTETGRIITPRDMSVMRRARDAGHDVAGLMAALLCGDLMSTRADGAWRTMIDAGVAADLARTAVNSIRAAQMLMKVPDTAANFIRLFTRDGVGWERGLNLHKVVDPGKKVILTRAREAITHASMEVGRNLFMDGPMLGRNPTAPGSRQVIILCGLPGAGKSTWATAQGIPVLGYDRCRAKQVNYKRTSRNEEQIKDAALKDLQQNQDPQVIWDATGLNIMSRTFPVSISNQMGACVSIVSFDVPFSVARQRNNLRAPQDRVPDEWMRFYSKKRGMVMVRECSNLATVDAEGLVTTVFGSWLPGLTKRKIIEDKCDDIENRTL